MSALWDLFLQPFVDPDAAYALKRGVAYAMMCLLVACLIFQSFLRRPGFIRRFDRELWKDLGDPKFVRGAGRWLTAILLVFATYLSASYFARVAPTHTYLHRWDAFHTVMGAKYHDELGYFDTYKCALAIDSTGEKHFQAVKSVRNLRTRNHVEVKKHLAENDCEARFTPARLEEFRRDLNTFGPSMNGRDWQRLFTDKGFNGTPFYTVVVTALLGVGGTSLDELTRIALLDPLLMLLAFGAVGWAFGVRRAAVFAIFFCSFFPNRYLHMGGSILRFDYVAALTIAICALKKDKWALAGVLLAWASMVRIFPILFAGAVGLKIIADVIADRRIATQHLHFVAALCGSLLAFGFVSYVGLEGGSEDWLSWLDNMKIHNKKSASFRIGFKHLFMLDGSIENVRYGAMQKTFHSRRIAYFVSTALLLAPLFLSIRRLSAGTFAALFGVVSFFLFIVSTRYYYSVVALVFLVDRDIFRNKTLLSMGAVLFGASAFDFFYFGTYSNTALMYNFIVGAQMTAFAIVLSLGLLFDPGLDEGESKPIDYPDDVRVHRGPPRLAGSPG